MTTTTRSTRSVPRSRCGVGLPVPEVAALLKVTERTVYRWTKPGGGA